MAESPQAIVAVAGISPPLVDTAISLFDPNGGKSSTNHHFFNNLLIGNGVGVPGKDKIFPFPMFEPPKPNFKPFQPAQVAPLAVPVHVQQKPSSENDKTPVNGPVSALTPLTPLQPQQSLEPHETTSVDVHVQEEQQHYLQVESSSSSQIPEASTSNDNQALELSEEQQFSSNSGGWTTTTTTTTPSPTSPSTTTTGGGWSQSSQGNQNAGGNQHMSMNLNANQADFTTTSNVNMQVLSDQTGGSNIHYFGSRGNSKPHHQPHEGHHVHQHGNGVTNYVIQFKRTQDENESEV